MYCKQYYDKIYKTEQGMKMASYFVIDFKKYGGAEAYKNILGHNLRQREYRDRPNIDTTKSDKNIILTTTNQTWHEYMDECNQKARKSGGRALKKGSSDFFSIVVDCSVIPGWKEEDYIRYLRDAERWLRERFQGQKILASAIHVDEKKPHLHFTVSFFSEEKGRWNQRNLAKEKKTHLDTLLWDFKKDIGKKYGLQRGDGKPLEKAKKAINQSIQIVEEKKSFGLLTEKYPVWNPKGLENLAKMLAKNPEPKWKIQYIHAENTRLQREKKELQETNQELQQKVEELSQELLKDALEIERLQEEIDNLKSENIELRREIERLRSHSSQSSQRRKIDHNFDIEF